MAIISRVDYENDGGVDAAPIMKETKEKAPPLYLGAIACRDLAKRTKPTEGRRAISSRSPARWSGIAFAPGLERRRLGLSDSQGETPNSFSMSAIIGCVKPALRNSAKSSATARSHSVPSCSEIGLPLWAR